MTLIYKTVPAKRKRQLKAKTDDCTLDRVRIAGAIAIGGIVPQMYRQELQLALKALNLGEARPLLRPPGERRYRPETVGQHPLGCDEGIPALWHPGSAPAFAREPQL